jgi:hypothetical protein
MGIFLDAVPAAGDDKRKTDNTNVIDKENETRANAEKAT